MRLTGFNVHRCVQACRCAAFLDFTSPSHKSNSENLLRIQRRRWDGSLERCVGLLRVPVHMTDVGVRSGQVFVEIAYKHKLMGNLNEAALADLAQIWEVKVTSLPRLRFLGQFTLVSI